MVQGRNKKGIQIKPLFDVYDCCIVGAIVEGDNLMNLIIKKSYLLHYFLPSLSCISTHIYVIYRITFYNHH